MEQIHFFAAVWPDGSDRWLLICREASDAEREAKMSAWDYARPEGSRGVLLIGVCDADYGRARLVKALRRVPRCSSPYYAEALTRFARQVCRSCMTQTGVYGGVGELRGVPETLN